MSETKEDFLFGKIYEAKEGEYGGSERTIVNLSDVCRASSILKSSAFPKAVNRLFIENKKNRIYAEHSYTAFDLGQFCSNVSIDDIDGVCISRRSEKNTNRDYTFSLRLYFEHGILELSSDWNMCKEIRGDEAVGCFLVPLILSGYIKKAHYFDPVEPGVRLPECNSDDSHTIVTQFLNFSGYGNSYNVLRDVEFINWCMMVSAALELRDGETSYDTKLKLYSQAVTGNYEVREAIT